MKKLSVLGLFSGIGGFELGLLRGGMEVGAFCEIEPHCLEVLRKNFPSAVEFNDVADVDPTGFDVICGGFPCQDISIAGKNKGLLGGDKSSLWRSFRDKINEGRPKYAIIENVSALLSRGIEIILQDLAEIGYDATWTVYDSKYFGVPQRRRRVYIVAVRDGIPADSDILKFVERDSSVESHQQKVSSINESFEWNFTERVGKREPFAFFTRQRSDQFSECGVSGTLAKRDYKSYTDVIVCDNTVRRVAPNERLLLQGFPVDWWSGCGMTDTQKYQSNGMTVNVVQHIGDCIVKFDKEVSNV